jgi:hypothetical protein
MSGVSVSLKLLKKGGSSSYCIFDVLCLHENAPLHQFCQHEHMQ